MEYFTACLIVIGFICTCQVSAQSELSDAGKDTARKIAYILDALMRPTFWRRTWVCSRYLDFQILLDSSGSVGKREFNKAKEALKITIDYINNRWHCTISPTRSRVALIEFSTPRKTHVEFSFFDHRRSLAVKNAIDRINYDKGRKTATAIALKIARAQFLQSGRNRNRKVVWMLTDGPANAGGSPLRPAYQLKRMRVTVCVVAVGSKVNVTEINAIATPSCVFYLESFSAYHSVMESVYRQKE